MDSLFFFLLNSTERELALSQLTEQHKKELLLKLSSRFNFYSKELVDFSSRREHIDFALMTFADGLQEEPESIKEIISMLKYSDLSESIRPNKSAPIKTSYRTHLGAEQNSINIMGSNSVSIPTKSNKAPDQEQQEIVDCCNSDLIVDAFAGSGKTTVAGFIIDKLGVEKTLYTAFLTENIKEARGKLTKHAFTQDGLALQTVLSKSPFKDLFSHDKKYSRAEVVRDKLGFPEKMNLGNRQAKLWLISRLVQDTVSCFCQSQDERIELFHVPLSVPGEEARQKIMSFAINYWDLLCSGAGGDESHVVRYQHVMKYWSMNPHIQLSDGYENIIMDESQDINGAFFKVIQNHSDRNIVIIGDRYQELFRWRGAINSMDLFEFPHLPLRTSRRYGVDIADRSNSLLAKHSLPPRHKILGNDDVKSEVVFYKADDRFPNIDGAILTRTRSKIISIAANEIDLGNKFHIKTEFAPLVFVCKNIINLAHGNMESISHPYIGRCNSMFNLEAELEANPEPDVYFGLKLYKIYSDSVVSVIEKIIESSCAESEAMKIISTTHSIKGKEWNNVVIAPDYVYMLEQENIELDSELSVLYVAITRARKKAFVPIELKRYFQ